MAFSPPGKFSLQRATWLAPPPLADLCPNIIFSTRTSLTTLFKIVTPSLHYSTPLYFLDSICTVRYTTWFLFVCLFLPQDRHLDKGTVFRLFWSQLYFPCLAWCLAHSRHSVNPGGIEGVSIPQEEQSWENLSG